MRLATLGLAATWGWQRWGNKRKVADVGVAKKGAQKRAGNKRLQSRDGTKGWQKRRDKL